MRQRKAQTDRVMSSPRLSLGNMYILFSFFRRTCLYSDKNLTIRAMVGAIQILAPFFFFPRVTLCARASPRTIWLQGTHEPAKRGSAAGGTCYFQVQCGVSGKGAGSHRGETRYSNTLFAERVCTLAPTLASLPLRQFVPLFAFLFRSSAVITVTLPPPLIALPLRSLLFYFHI